MKLTFTPTVHSNGASLEDLLAQSLAAYRAIGGAVEEVQKAWPNGRDYYPQEQGALLKAQAEVKAQVQLLHEMQQQWLELALRIQDAAKPKKK